MPPFIAAQPNRRFCAFIGRERVRMLSIKMVATRRGTRVGSPVKNTDDVVAEPSTLVKRTRRRVIVTDQPQSEHTSDSQQNDAEEPNTAPSEPANPSKRGTRRSKLHHTEANQPDSTHEADVSESESCCSVASGILVQSTTRGRRRAPIKERLTAAVQQEVSEGESCSSPPAGKPRRSMRIQKKPSIVPAEPTTCKDDDPSEAESCSSVASLSKVIDTRMITRSHRRTAVSLGGDDPSEADSCSSAVSGPRSSTVRRSTRNRRTNPTEPIPIHLEESEPTEALASSAATRTRGKSKVKSADENQAYDSEGCHSGPSTSPRKMGGVFVLDSDSESVATNYSTVDSPCSLKARLTPCSSRTGSASSNRAVPASRTRSKVTVTHDASNATTGSKCEKDNKDSELEKDQTETPMDTVSDREDIEEMDEEEANRTVISADCQECSILDNLTLTLAEDIISSANAEVKMVDSENRQETRSVNDVTVSENTEHVEEKHSTEEQTPTEKDVKILEGCEKISEPAMENEAEAESVLEVHGDQASVSVMKPEKGVTVTEEDHPILVEEHDTEDQKSSYPAQTEKSVMVVVRAEEKDEAVEKTELVIEDNAAVLNQKPSKLVEKNIKFSEGVESEAAKVQDVSQEVSGSLTHIDLVGQDIENEQNMEVDQNTDIDAGHNDTEDQKSSAPVQTEKSMMVVGSEEKDEAVEKNIKVIEGVESEAAKVLDVSQEVSGSLTHIDLVGQDIENEQNMEVDQNTDIDAGHNDTEDQKSSAPAQTEKSMIVVGSEEKDEAVEEKIELVADDNAALVDQKPSELAEKSVKVDEGIDKSEAAAVLDVPQKVYANQIITVTYSDMAGQKVQDGEVEQHPDTYAVHHESELQNKVEDESTAETEQEGPSCSSKAQGHKTSVLQTKPEKRVLSLLDSSEDEESDSEGLSDEGCKKDAGDLESEDEAVRFDEIQPGSSSLFVIDTRPGLQPNEYYINTTHHEEDDHLHDSKAVEDEEDFVDEEADDDDEDSKTLFTTRGSALMKLSSSIDPGLKMKELGGLYVSFDGSKSKPVSNNLKKMKDQKNQDELLKNSVIVADFEKKDAVPPYKESKHAAKLKRKEEKAKTTGDGWFDMRAPELTEDLRNDLKALKMRSAMDPKRFYKKNDREGFPKYFQVGTVVDNPADFYHSRIPKKQRKRTIVEELLADAEFRSFNKRKYHEIMAEKAADAAGKITVNQQISIWVNDGA
ncbi:hypothetical protein MHYP_G00324730 [Metynnis hypsauchen]